MSRRSPRSSPSRSPRANPRVVKRKMSNWGVKRPEHRDWPQPTKSPSDATTIQTA